MIWDSDGEYSRRIFILLSSHLRKEAENRANRASPNSTGAGGGGTTRRRRISSRGSRASVGGGSEGGPKSPRVSSSFPITLSSHGGGPKSRASSISSVPASPLVTTSAAGPPPQLPNVTTSGGGAGAPPLGVGEQDGVSTAGDLRKFSFQTQTSLGGLTVGSAAGGSPSRLHRRSLSRTLEAPPDEPYFAQSAGGVGDRPTGSLSDFAQNSVILPFQQVIGAIEWLLALNPQQTFRSILSILILVVICNAFLFYRLWSIESYLIHLSQSHATSQQQQQQQPYRRFGLPTPPSGAFSPHPHRQAGGGGGYDPSVWKEVLDEQHSLHLEELERWHQVLHTSILLVEQMQAAFQSMHIHKDVLSNHKMTDDKASNLPSDHASFRKSSMTSGGVKSNVAGTESKSSNSAIDLETSSAASQSVSETGEPSIDRQQNLT